MTQRTSPQHISSKETLAAKSISALPPASTVGAVVAVVLLFSPWYIVEEPFFGIPISVNAFEATSPLLQTTLAYPLIGLYLIAVGSLWASRSGFLSISAGLTLAYTSHVGAFVLIMGLMELVFSVMGSTQYGLWGSAAYTFGFGLWALTHDTFLRPKKDTQQTEGNA